MFSMIRLIHTCERLLCASIQGNILPYTYLVPLGYLYTVISQSTGLHVVVVLTCTIM